MRNEAGGLLGIRKKYHSMQTANKIRDEAAKLTVPRSTLARQGNKLPQVHNPLAGDLWFVTTPEDPSPTTPQEVHE